MGCPYEYYKEEESYFPRLYCNIDDKYCIYSKKCNQVNKFIPLDNQKECYKMVEQEIKNIPSGSYYVQNQRPSKKGNLYLYIVIGDKVEKILSNFVELNQNYVYLKETLDGYIVSLMPFTEKRTYTRKANKIDNGKKSN